MKPMVFNFAISTFENYADINQYFVRQKKIDYFEIKLKMNPGPINETKITSALKTHIHKFFDIPENEIEFNVSFVNEIPLPPTGKFLSVTSDLKTAVVN